MKEQNIFVYKNKSHFFIVAKGAKLPHIRDREADEGLGLLSVTPQSGHIFIFTPCSHRSIFRTPLSTSLMELIWVTSQRRVLDPQGHCSR